MSVTEAEVRQSGDSAGARSRRETRRRLVEAGTELFAHDGLHRVTSAQIARRAGVASGTFYLHFRDKQELFREIVRAAFDALRARQESAAAGEDGSLGALRARYRVLLDVAEENQNLIRVLFGRSQEGASLGEELIGALVPGIEQRMRERAESGELEGAHSATAAQAIVGMATRVIAWWVEDPSRAPKHEVVDTLITLHPASRGERSSAVARAETEKE